MRVSFPALAGAVVPVAVDLVADLPVLHAVTFVDVGVLDPVGGLLGGAGTVVRGQDRLGADPLRGGHEVVEVGARRGPAAAGDGVGLPVVGVRDGAAGVAQLPDSGCLHQR